MTRNSKLLLLICTLLMLLPLSLFAEGGDKWVALIPLWAEEGDIAQQFNEELYVALAAMDGFQPISVDMTDLPPDIPIGGFPPFISPHRSLTEGMPLAVTGSVFIDPASGLRTLRLYLWQESDYRPLFTDEMVATNREVVGMFLPIMLRWLFSWIPPEEVPTIVVETIVVVEEVEVEVTRTVIQEQQVIVYMGMEPEVPNRWLYFGLRAGGNVQIFDPQLSQTFGNADYLDFNLRNASLAAHLHFQFLNFRLDPRYLFLGLQVEGIATHDFNNDAFSLVLPAMLRFTLRRGTSSFSLLGGAYVLMPLPPFLGDESQITFLPEDGIGPFAGLGWTAGFGMGNRVGPGNLFLEIRWSHDMFTNRIEWGEGGGADFRRSVVSVSLGYEFGFFRRR